MKSDDISTNLKDINQWTRVLYMLLFGVLFNVATFVLWAVVLIQALFALVSGAPSDNVKQLAASLSQYIFDIARFVSYGSEEKPFPFQPWPEVVIEENVSDEPPVTAVSAADSSSNQSSSVENNAETDAVADAETKD